jgi:hypothetical protein
MCRLLENHNNSQKLFKEFHNTRTNKNPKVIHFFLSFLPKIKNNENSIENILFNQLQQNIPFDPTQQGRPGSFITTGLGYCLSKYY